MSTVSVGRLCRAFGFSHVRVSAVTVAACCAAGEEGLVISFVNPHTEGTSVKKGRASSAASVIVSALNWSWSGWSIALRGGGKSLSTSRGQSRKVKLAVCHRNWPPRVRRLVAIRSPISCRNESWCLRKKPSRLASAKRRATSASDWWAGAEVKASGATNPCVQDLGPRLRGALLDACACAPSGGREVCSPVAGGGRVGGAAGFDKVTLYQTSAQDLGVATPFCAFRNLHSLPHRARAIGRVCRAALLCGS